MNLRILPEAAAELNEAIDYYEAQRAGLGVAIYRDFRHTLADVLEYPKANRVLTKNCRRKNLRRFRYGIVYRVADDGLLVVAFMHLHRKPGYWIERL